MAQNTKKINKRRVSVAKEKSHHGFLFLFLILIIAAAVVYGVLVFVPREQKPSEEEPKDTTTTTEEKKETEKKEEESKEEQTTEPAPETEKNNTQYEGEDPNSYESLTGIINYIGIVDGNLSVRVSIDQLVAGACTFAITTPTGKTINGSGELSAGPTSSFCSFSTPATESGTWKISVTATSTNKRGIITGEANL